MRLYTRQRKHYCGVDLHARSMYVCVLNQAGEVLLHRNLQCEPALFLETIRPYREDLVVGVECIFTWYWLADLCAKEGIAFVLGHALYMRAIHGAKAKNDRIDSRKIAALLKGGLMPQAYVYPAEMRATRDLMRRRLHFVRQRGQLLAHIQMTHHQYNLPSPGKRISYRSNREGVGEGFEDASTRESVAADLALVDQYEHVIGEMELKVLRQARGHDPNSFPLLRSIPGTGRVLALTILYEIHDIARSAGEHRRCLHLTSGGLIGVRPRRRRHTSRAGCSCDAARVPPSRTPLHGRTPDYHWPCRLAPTLPAQAPRTPKGWPCGRARTPRSGPKGSSVHRWSAQRRHPRRTQAGEPARRG